MPLQDVRKELAPLINSRHPLIYLETFEVTRATGILARVADELALPFYAWTVTFGLARGNGAPIHNTQQPAQGLSQIEALADDAICLLKDFHKHLSDGVIVRKLRDLAQSFRRKRRSFPIPMP
jgi:hypothetical protein